MMSRSDIRTRNIADLEDLAWQLLESCQRCRNAMMHPLQPMSQPRVVRVMRGRLQSLPARHESTHADLVTHDDCTPVMISLKDYPQHDEARQDT